MINLSNLNGFVHPHKVLHGDGLFGLGVNQEGGCHVLDQPQRCVLSVSRPSGISFVSAVCRSGNVYQFLTLCIGLSTNPQCRYLINFLISA